MRTRAVILAAGQGTRMKSSIPKVLHPILGYPMAWYAIQSARQATGLPPLLVIGYGAEEVRQALEPESVNGLEFVVQEGQLGTGHAVQQAASSLKGKADQALVTYADMPLLQSSTLSKLIEAQRSHQGPISMLTVQGQDARGFGRVLRDENGKVQAIVEEAQASQEEMAIREFNPGVYCFATSWLWDSLERIPLSPKGEYYLTDLIAIAVQDGLSVQALSMDDPLESIGINTRIHLAEVERAMRQQINERWMLAGVTLIDPWTTYIEPGVSLGMDSVVWPNTYLQGSTQVGQNCQLGPNSIIRDSRIGDGCQVTASMVEGALLEDEVRIGPFARLRKGAHLAQGVHMGNFGEVKNSYLGPNTRIGHFSYIGDATVGAEVNIGAGTITCNFSLDGVKNKTDIGEGAFIGSDTMLVAPVKIGEGAATGTGSVVTKNVPDHTLVVGVPARAIRKLSPRKKNGSE